MKDRVTYSFRTQYFGLSEFGVHLIRNGLSSESISYKSIDTIRIVKRKEVDNWIGALLFGSAIFSLGVCLSWGVLNVIVTGKFAGSYKTIFLLLIPLIGVFFIYSAVKRGPVMVLNYDSGKVVKLPLREIFEKRKYPVLIRLLSERMGSKLIVEVDE